MFYKGGVTMKKTVSSSMKLCSTCTNWCGKQEPNQNRGFVSYDDSEKGKCSAMYGKNTLGFTAGCSRWEQRFK